MVLVAPNGSLVSGRVKYMGQDSKEEGEPYVELEVIDSKDVGNLVNFTRDKKGTTIIVRFRSADRSKMVVGRTIEAHVEYIGDERGGVYQGKL